MANYPFIKPRTPETPDLDTIFSGLPGQPQMPDMNGMVTAGNIGTVNPVPQELPLPDNSWRGIQNIPELDNLFLPQPSTYPNSPMDPLGFLSPQTQLYQPPVLTEEEQSSNLPKPIKSLDIASKLNPPPTSIPPSAPLEDDEMKAAIAERRQLSGFADMLQGAGTIGASFAGVARPEDLGAGVRKSAEMVVKDVKDYRAGLKEKIDLEDEKQISDPNSATSILIRQAAKDMLQKMRYGSLTGLIKDSMSAKQVQKALGGVNLSNLYNQYESAQSRKDLFKLKTMEKDAIAEVKRDKYKLELSNKLNGQVEKLDKGLGLSDINEAINTLKDYRYEPADPAMDIATLYKFIKVLDPDSVVREGEIALTKQGQSMMQSFGLNIKRITSGQVISEALRKDMIDAMRRMRAARVDTFKRKTSGIRAAVEKGNLYPDVVFPNINLDDLEKNEKEIDDWEDVK